MMIGIGYTSAGQEPLVPVPMPLQTWNTAGVIPTESIAPATGNQPWLNPGSVDVQMYTAGVIPTESIAPTSTAVIPISAGSSQSMLPWLIGGVVLFLVMKGN